MRYHISRDSNGPLSKFPYGLVASVLHLLQIRSLHLLEKYLVMVVLLAYAGPMMRHRVTVMHRRREERRRCHLPNRTGLRVCFTIHCGSSAKSLQGSMASERCWEVHKKCCITGIKGIAGSKPKDIVSMHIWQHAYQKEVSPLFSHF